MSNAGLPGLLLAGFITRATYLLPVLTVALLIGEPWAKLLRFPQLRGWIGGRIARLNHKLNRPQRGTATRLYRGMAALAMLLAPAAAVGLLLMRPVAGVQLLATLLLVALFGEAMRSHSVWRQWRVAKKGELILQSRQPAYLFADTHALLRYHIIDAGEHFATALIGGSIYFLLASLPGLLLYFMLAAAARYYSPRLENNRAFGWSAHALFTSINMPPRFIACLLLWLAALCTPRTAPFSTLRQLGITARCFYGWLASLLVLSLGGIVPSPAGEVILPWLGTGNPKPMPSDFSRALQLIAIATLIWICLLGSSLYL